MTTVANCFDINEAQRLKMILESFDIPSMIPDEATASIAPFQFLTAAGVRLQVADEHVDEARQILDQEKEES